MNDTNTPLRINRRMALLALAGTTVELAACGGGGGVAGLSSGGTGSFTSGTITGLGSVIVNGIRYDDSSATVLRDDDDINTSTALRVGMVVWIQGGTVTPAAVTGGLATASATRISFGSEWVGQVTAKTTTSFQMLGQTVNVLASTLFAGTATDLATLAVNAYVEVFGYLDAGTGQLQATLVIASTSAPSAFRLTGTVTALDTTARTFTLGGQSFQYGASTPVPATWGVGSLVRVRFDVTPVGGVWQVLRVRLRGTGLERLQVEDHAESEVHGIVTSITSATAFSVNGLPVNASGATISGTVALGVNVEVEGAVVNGTLIATGVQVETETEIEQEEFRFIGAVSNLDTVARTFTIKGQTVRWDGTTQIEVSNWVTGATPTVEVRALRVSGAWLATRIKLAS